MADPKYYRLHRIVSHPLEKYITLKECIIELIKAGRVIVDFDDAVETNYIFCITNGLSIIQFGGLEPVVLNECITQEGFFPVIIFDKLTVNMTSCSEVEEETNDEDCRQENSPGETDKTLATLEAMPIRLNWGQIFSFPNKTRQHMIAALKNSEIYADKDKGAEEMSEGLIQYGSCKIANTFTDDDILLGSKPHNRPLFVIDYIKE